MPSKLFGDWNKFRHVLEKLADNADQYQGIVQSMADKIVEKLWDIIEQQAIELEPLKEEYRQRKIAKGYDERILIKTGDFLNSLAVLDIQSDGDSMTVFIGVEDGETKTGISMRELAEYLEYGTENMIGRHPMQRSWEQMKSEVESEVASKLKSAIGGAIK
jgi:HK97 gp10 family phage protein